LLWTNFTNNEEGVVERMSGGENERPGGMSGGEGGEWGTVGSMRGGSTI
jgi:hypothetical protein